MGQFFTGEDLNNKLTDIIWKAKKELLILSPFIHLDDYCRKVFKNYQHDPELEVVLVFGKNEREAGKSLNKNDLDFFKAFPYITIIYCKELHAKFYSNEKEGLLTSLNLLDKSMEKNIEYGIYFTNTFNPIDKLFDEAVGYTNEVIFTKPCVFVKRPQFKKEYLGLKKTYLGSEIVLDVTEELYRNRDFDKKYYKEFNTENTIGKELKPSRADFNNNKSIAVKSKNNASSTREQTKSFRQDFGFCIRTGESIPFNPDKPFSFYAYQTWAQFGDEDYPENYCHKTGRNSNGKTSKAKPIL